MIKHCLHLYEQASGQMVNFSKSSLLFSPNVNEDAKIDICNLLQVPICMNHGNYLGGPCLIGRNKAKVFAFIKEKAWKRLHGWRNKILSRASKEILLICYSSSPSLCDEFFFSPDLSL